MKKWTWDCTDRVVFVIGALAGAAFLTALCVFLAKAAKADAHVWAAWVQAVGSVCAIFAAMWISRHDREEREVRDLKAENEMREKVEFEVANLAYDVTHFLIRTASTDQTKKPRYLVDEHEYSELLERLGWVRRSAKNGADLEDARTLRTEMVETTALLRLNANWRKPIPQKELDSMESSQRTCSEISDRRKGVRGKYSQLV